MTDDRFDWTDIPVDRRRKIAEKAASKVDWPRVVRMMESVGWTYLQESVSVHSVRKIAVYLANNVLDGKDIIESSTGGITVEKKVYEGRRVLRVMFVGEEQDQEAR